MSRNTYQGSAGSQLPREVAGTLTSCRYLLINPKDELLYVLGTCGGRRYLRVLHVPQGSGGTRIYHQDRPIIGFPDVSQSWTCRFSTRFYSFIVRMYGRCLYTNSHWLTSLTILPACQSKSPPPIFALTAIYLFTATLIRLLTMTFTFLRQTQPF